MNYVNETGQQYCYLAFHPLSGGERRIKFYWSPGSLQRYTHPTPISGSIQKQNDEFKDSEFFDITKDNWFHTSTRSKKTSRSVYLHVDNIQGNWEVRVMSNGNNLSYDHGYVQGFRINSPGKYALKNYFNETKESDCYLALRPLNGTQRIRFCWSPGSSQSYTYPDPIQYQQNTAGEQIVQKARSKIGCNYQYGGTGPDTFDCSGFTQWVYAQFGIKIPHGAQSQA